jgi:hypothetical protein
VELNGDADDAPLADLVAYVDGIAEIPNSIRNGTPVTLKSVMYGGIDRSAAG